MTKIKVKSFFSIICSKISITLCRLFFKGGTNFPGKVALKLDKDILSLIGKNYEVILVTGTNGKTTTTSMIYNILKSSKKEVITNASGANMFTGIVTCFIANYSFKKKNQDKTYAIIEVDEANLKFITDHIKPKIITITNLFRDQLDRYGEVYTTLEKILEGVVKTEDSILVLNGDESLLGKLNLKNPTEYYGMEVGTSKSINVNADAKFCKFCKTTYEYNFVTYNHLGDFYCPNCGYKRPSLKYCANTILEQTPAGSLVTFNNKEFYINQPGNYNIYNGLCAYAICKELGIEDNIIKDSLQSQESSFGRQETINIQGKEVKIILVKNPAGYDEAINSILLDKKPLDLAFMLNDNYADGRDVSWIWDVHFEKLTELDVDKILVSGIRLYDMSIRLKIAGFDANKFILCDKEDELLNEFIKNKEKPIYVLATYTAMTSFRKFLSSKGYVKDIW